MSINFNLCQEFIDTIQIGIYSLDLEGNILYINDFLKNLSENKKFDIDKIISNKSIIEKIKRGIAADNETTDWIGDFNVCLKNTWKIIKVGDDSIIQGIIEDITDFQRNQKKLEYSENKFRELFNTMAQGVVYQDKEGNIFDANPAALKILGLSMDQLQNRSSKDPEWKTIHEDGSEYPGEDHPAMYSLRTGNPLYGVLMGVYNPTKKGIVWILVSSIPRLFNELGKAEEVFVTFEDITDLRNWQIALARSEERYRKLLNSATDIIFLKDSNYRYLMINTAYEEFLGISENEVIGRSDFELLPADISNNCYKSDQKALTSGEIVISYEGVNDKIYETQKFAVELSDSEVGIGGIIKDVTELYKTQRTLKENEEKYRLLVENQNDLIVKVDKEGRFLFVSPSYCKMFGKSENELIGNRFIPLVHPEDRDVTLKEMEKLYTTPYTCYIEQRALTVNGWKWLGWIDKAITDVHGNVIEIIGNGRDITDKKILELELNKSKDLYVKSNIEKSKFLAELSHEIRSPLQTVLNSSNLIQSKIECEPVSELNELFGLINLSGEKIISTINSILNMSEITLGVYKPIFKEINLKKEILDVLIPTYKHIAKQKGLLLQIDTATNINNIKADSYAVTQIISNLLDNSVKYTNKGNITVSLFEKDNKTCLSIKDTGIGIESDLINHLFDAYNFDNLSYIKKFNGTGLGLALVNEYCKISNAAIEVDSVLGKGSVFTVIFNN